MKKQLSILVIFAAILLAALAASPVYGAKGDGSQARGPATHIIVFVQGADPIAVAQDLDKIHGVKTELIYRKALLGMSGIVPPGKEKDVLGHPSVAYIERNQIVRAFPQDVPTGIDRADADLNSTANIDGSDERVDVDIAIIDTGIDLDHPDLNVFASTNCARGGPFGGDCKEGGGDDGNGHGTHVAGIAAAIDNGTGVVGMAPGARLWAVRVLGNDGSGWMSWIIGGIDWVTDNADEIEVANMSLGCECPSQALDTAIASSVEAGVVYAVAAGNSGKDASSYSPANHPDVITVSALADFDGKTGGLASPTCRTDEDDTLANFSNWGSTVEVTAPGVCIRSTWNNGGYNTISGTSMASPHVAGAAALLASGANAPETKAEVDAIIQAIIDSGTFDWTDDSGDGIQEPLLNVADQAAGPQDPVSDAGPDQTVNDDDGDGVETLTLDGSSSSDSDGSIVSYEWKEGATVLGTNATITASFDVAGSPHTVTLTVTDSDGLTGTDDVAITVNPNQPPVADAGPDQAVADADGDGFEAVTLDGSASSDSDGSIISYEWKEGTTVLGTTAKITASFDVNGSPHSVTLTVTDNGGAAVSDSVVITVSEADSTAPVISNVASGNVTDTSADITWDTGEASDSVVNYGTTMTLGSSVSVGALVSGHSVGLSGLTAETTYYYEVESTDGSGNTATDNLDGSYYSVTTAAAPTVADTASLDPITYALSGGKNSDKNLLVTIKVVDNLGASVESASVSIDLTDGTTIWKGTGSTGSDGTVTFRLRNAPVGCYSTDVTNVSAAGLTWDEVPAEDPGKCKVSGSNNKGNGGSLQVQ